MMNKLLNFTPEPFAGLDHDRGENEDNLLWFGDGETEEEIRGRRRPRLTGRPAGSASFSRGPRRRMAPSPMGAFRLPPKWGRRPRPSSLPRLIPIPFVPPARLAPPPYPQPPWSRAMPASDDSHGAEQAGSQGSGGLPGSQPANDPPAEYIRWVQDRLNKTLGMQLPLDGIMNRETRCAVRMFQQRQGLPITGLVGPETERALQSVGTDMGLSYDYRLPLPRR